MFASHCGKLLIVLVCVIVICSHVLSVMEFIEGYESDSCFSAVSECEANGEKGDNVATVDELGEEMHARSVRKVYLITYSQADLTRFPTRNTFAKAVLHSFSNTPGNVIQWSCCREEHKSSGHHYHMAIKLDKNQRWLASKRFLEYNNGISVHFSSIHRDYYSAWQYVSKCDEEVLESDGHPDLWNSTFPKTTRASAANKPRVKRPLAEQEGSEEEAEEIEGAERKTKGKRKRMSAFDLSEIIVSKGIKSRMELLALASEQKEEGKTDIAEFIVNRGAKVVAEVIDTAWEMHTAKERLSRSKKTRLELLRDCNKGQCVDGCDGQWLVCAEEVLKNNGVIASSFGESVFDLLVKGRGKYRNIMIVGPANCGKTFLLNPINKIFKTFSNPACTSFAWVGAEEAECLFLNDFRWSPAIIQWHDFLLLLEGQLVHLPAPKSHYAKDIVFDKDTPIFATGKHPIMYVKGGAVDERETEMMAVRWKVFHFNSQISQEKQKEIPPCCKCFARLILGYPSEENSI